MTWIFIECRIFWSLAIQAGRCRYSIVLGNTLWRWQLLMKMICCSRRQSLSHNFAIFNVILNLSWLKFREISRLIDSCSIRSMMRSKGSQLHSKWKSDNKSYISAFRPSQLWNIAKHENTYNRLTVGNSVSGCHETFVCACVCGMSC